MENSRNHPFSPTVTASGLTQMEIAREAPARMAVPTPNGPQPITPLLDAAHARLASMEAPREIGHAEELAGADKKLETWRTTFSMMKSRLVEMEESSNSSEVNTPADTRMAPMRSKISEFERRTKELKSRASDLVDIILGSR